MASGNYVVGTDNQYIFAHVYWWESDSSTASNTSSVNVTVSYYRTNAYTTWGTSTITVGVGSQSSAQSVDVSFSTSEVNVYSNKFNGFEHAADGSLDMTINVTGTCNSGFSFSDSRRITLDTIQRYSNISSFNVIERSFDYAKIELSGDSVVSTSAGGAYYCLNNGSWTEFTWVNNAPTDITITGLSPNTSYSIKFKLKRASSGLVSTSSDYSFATLSATTLAADSTNTNTIGSTFKFNVSNYTSGNTVACTFKSGSVTIGTASIVATTTTSVTFDSSTVKAQLYALCPNSNTLDLTLSTSETNAVTGTAYAYTYPSIQASVTNSNPTFSTFAFSNTDAATSSRIASSTLLGNTTEFISGYGNLRVTISTANKATKINSAGSIISYTITVSGINKTVTVNESTGDVIYDFGVLTSIGSTTISIYATDSRGNKSSTVTKTVSVYKYTQPSISVTLSRYNNFENPILISLTSYLSKVITSSKTSGANSIGSIKYRYAEVGAAYPSTYTTLTGYTTSSDTSESTNNKWMITFSNTSSTSPFLSLDSSKSYNVQFVVSDTFTTGGISAEFSIVQGIPIMGMYDNGYITIGKNPEIPSSSMLQVNSDIMLKMSDGTFVNLLDQLTKNDVLVKKLYLLEHPVGDIIVNLSGVNPGTTYGGTWVQIKDVFLLAAGDTYTAGNVGGESTHTLTDSEIPSHSHSLPIHTSGSEASGYGLSGTLAFQDRVMINGLSSSSPSTSSKGGGQAHNNMPPYLVVYVWKRTA